MKRKMLISCNDTGEQMPNKSMIYFDTSIRINCYIWEILVISDKYRCIFIHVPKTAGTSIEYKLQSFNALRGGVQDHRSLREIEPHGIRHLLQDIGSLNYEMAQNRLKNIIRRQRCASRQQFQQYFKFSFVRNPWTRALSWYQNVMRDENHRKKHRIPEDCSYEAFLTDYPDQWALRPQLYWLVDHRGEIPLDFIGRFENLSEDFAHVCKVLQLENSELPRMIASTSKSHYTEIYNEITKRIIAERYAEEIDYFGYRFE